MTLPSIQFSKKIIKIIIKIVVSNIKLHARPKSEISVEQIRKPNESYYSKHTQNAANG